MRYGIFSLLQGHFSDFSTHPGQRWYWNAKAESILTFIRDTHVAMIYRKNPSIR